MLAEIFGPDLLIVLLVAVVLLFGGASIPKLARNLGSAKKEFEKGLREGHGDADAGPGGTGGSVGQAPEGAPQNPNPNPGPTTTH